jgi:CDP-4-dehydro-6-deoxyglucose reductase
MIGLGLEIRDFTLENLLPLEVLSMSTPHPLGIHSPDQSKLEGVDPRFLMRGLLHARDQTLKAFQEIRGILKEGMTEKEASKGASRVLLELGSKKQWHRTHIRFGTGTTLSFNEPTKSSPNLNLHDPVYFDLGPVWADPETGLEYEGDYGDTFVMGENPEAQHCADAARLLFQKAKARHHAHPARGSELYGFLKEEARALGYILREDVSGHRIGDFPHHRFTKMNLSEAPFIPSESLWVLEVQILDPRGRFGAFFEDIL